MKNQILRFGLSGVAGYIVDSVVLYAVMAMGVGFLRGRLVSFFCAVMVTFVLNRRYTFAQQLQSAVMSPPPLSVEFGRYLMAMSLGGLLNLATYWLVLRVVPHSPALFAVAVAAGSLVGMVANFASAKWWVFIERPVAESRWQSLFALTTARSLIAVQAMFWMSHLHHMALPGLYMDAANPDYLAASTLNPELVNPIWVQPTALFPILGNLYHGVQNYYVSLPVFALLGFNMLALRIAQGLFGSGILILMQLVLQRATGSIWLAFAGSLGLATELAFIASFRTQMYIVVAGAFWLLWAIYLALPPTRSALDAPPASGREDHRLVRSWFFSGVCLGLAVYSYFVFAFFVPAFVMLGWWHTRSWRAAWVWLLGFALGMQTYVLGYASLIISLGGPGPTLEWLQSATQDLGPLSAEQGFAERLANAWMMIVLSLENMGNELLIFQATSPGSWVDWKMRLLVAAPVLLIALNLVRTFASRPLAAGSGRDTGSGLLAHWHLAMLPITFMAVSLLFGGRLWAHHFSPLVPVTYLVLLLTLSQLRRLIALPLPRWTGAALVVAMVVGNLQQQHGFFDRLDASGGVARFSNALNRMADDALSMSPELIHVFPEWGFMIPFALLTGNHRSYDIDMNPANLARLANEGKTLRLYYWDPAASATYRDSLVAQGYSISTEGNYKQRDQNIAFYWMEAVVAAD